VSSRRGAILGVELPSDDDHLWCRRQLLLCFSLGVHAAAALNFPFNQTVASSNRDQLRAAAARVTPHGLHAPAWDRISGLVLPLGFMSEGSEIGARPRRCGPGKWTRHRALPALLPSSELPGAKKN